jgi:hypothetical protein
MADKKIVRAPDGKFLPGHTGNPAGRPPRVREMEYLELTQTSCSLADWKAVVKKAVEQAKAGDYQARRFLAGYLMGEPVNRSEINAQVAAVEQPNIVVRWSDDPGR